MKHFFTFITLILFSCNPQEEAVPKYPIKELLHQKNWKVISMQAERKSDGELLDWYAQLPSCIKDNTFTTEAPGTGTVGELHGEEGNALCQEIDLAYKPHIAGWKLNEQHNIFSVSLFASGHQMLYGYAMEESYDYENWMIEEFDEDTLRVRVSKIKNEVAYFVSITFKAFP